VEPGRVYEFDIDLWATSNVFLRGHRVRLSVSSSSFPKYDRNPNTGDEFGMDTSLKVADQQLYHDERHPSHVLLPVIK
jgi:hypothetical protein